MDQPVAENRSDVELDVGRYKSETYSSDDVSEIIGIALRNHNAGSSDTASYNEILAIGSDFGLTEMEIRTAFDELKQQDVHKELLWQAGLAFKIHVLTFLAIIAGLFVLNLVISPSVLWSVYPMIMWGSVVALHGLILKFTPETAAMLTVEDENHG